MCKLGNVSFCSQACMAHHVQDVPFTLESARPLHVWYCHLYNAPVLGNVRHNPASADKLPSQSHCAAGNNRNNRVCCVWQQQHRKLLPGSVLLKHSCSPPVATWRAGSVCTAGAGRTTSELPVSTSAPPASTRTTQESPAEAAATTRPSQAAIKEEPTAEGKSALPEGKAPVTAGKTQDGNAASAAATPAAAGTAAPAAAEKRATAAAQPSSAAAQSTSTQKKPSGDLATVPVDAVSLLQVQVLLQGLGHNVMMCDVWQCVMSDMRQLHTVCGQTTSHQQFWH